MQSTNPNQMEQVVKQASNTAFEEYPESIQPILNKGKNNHVFKLNVNGQNKILRLHDSTKQLFNSKLNRNTWTNAKPPVI